MSVRVMLVLLLAAGTGWAHGNGPILVPRPTTPPDPPPRKRPIPIPNSPAPTTPPNRPPPKKEPPPPPAPPAPPPPPDKNQPNPRPPDTPNDQPRPPDPDDEPDGPRTKRPMKRPAIRKAVRDRRPTGWNQDWKLWWELNRENLVGFTHVLRDKGAVTPGAVGARDPLAGKRTEIRDALLRVAQGDSDRLLRASALIALGRLGDPETARLFVSILRDRKEPADVHEAAAVGLGMLGPLNDDALRKATRENLAYLLARRDRFSPRAHSFVIIAAGLRARQDSKLVLHLTNRVVAGARSGDEAVTLAFACGLAGDRLVMPELLRAVRRGRFAHKRIGDVGRAHAIHALGRIGDPGTARMLLKVLHSRSARTASLRAAVLSLARLLRTGAIDDAEAHTVTRALKKIFEEHSDPVLQGFCAIAIGGAKEPYGVLELQDAVDKSGRASVKGFCALALGLAARNSDENRQRRIRAFLAQELAKTREASLASALSISLGLAGAQESLDMLLDRVHNRRLGHDVRGAAAQAVGLLGRDTPRVGKVLIEALDSGPRPMLGDVALALGMVGRHGTAQRLIRQLDKTSSTLQQGRIMLALGHLGSAGAVDPLIAILENKGKRTAAREFAAVALGMLTNRRTPDVLFDLDSDINYFSLTSATHELVRLY